MGLDDILDVRVVEKEKSKMISRFLLEQLVNGGTVVPFTW